MKKEKGKSGGAGSAKLQAQSSKAAPVDNLVDELAYQLWREDRLEFARISGCPREKMSHAAFAVYCRVVHNGLKYHREKAMKLIIPVRAAERALAQRQARRMPSILARMHHEVPTSQAYVGRRH